MDNENNYLEIQNQEIADIQGSERLSSRLTYIPRTDIVETGEDVILNLDMPGVEEESIDITLEKDVLTVNASSKIDIPDGWQVYYSEFEFGNYERSFKLTNEIDQANIRAAYENGVLKLVLPKTEIIKRKKIKVELG